jgi:hypothetical protein
MKPPPKCANFTTVTRNFWLYRMPASGGIDDAIEFIAKN